MRTIEIMNPEGQNARERWICGRLHWRTKGGTWREYTDEQMATRELLLIRAEELARTASFREDDK